MKSCFKFFSPWGIGAIALSLVACGGGGGGSSSLELKGVAATGFAIEGGSVSVQCASGTGTATTLSNGSYSVVVSGGVGPCLVTVTKGDLVLRSIAPKTSTGTAVANVTPISSAIVTALVQAKGASSVEALVTNTAFTPSNTELNTAVSAVIVKINEALDLLGKSPLDPNTDLLGNANYVAATSSNPNAGDALDKALDALVSENGSLPTTLTTAINQTVDANVDPSATGSIN